MVSILRQGNQNAASFLRGLSSDTKPVVKFGDVFMANGSVFEEIDTGDKYMYDAENEVWHRVAQGEA